MASIPIDKLPSMISRDQAAAHVRESNSRIATVYAWREIPGRLPSIYWTSATPLEDCWIAYLESEGFALVSSTIVVIDPIDGAVLYFGSASDEG